MKYSYTFPTLLAMICYTNISAQQGRLDSTFGNYGIVQISYPNEVSSGQTGTVQPDGKMLIGGWLINNATSDYSYGVARMNPDGSPDESFGTGGKMKGNYGIEFCTEIAVQNDGKTIVLGRAANAVTQNYQPGLIRLTPNGVLDTTFGTTGLAISAYDGDHIIYGSLLIQPDNKILVAATQFNGDDDDITITRYKSDGTLDASFSGDGLQVIDISSIFGQSEDWVSDFELQSDGKIIIGGGCTYSDSVGTYNALVRVKTNGQVDASFGLTAGKVVWKTPGADHSIAGIEVLPDNKILCMMTNYDLNDILLARFNSNGTPDLSFGINGMTSWNNTFDANTTLHPRYLGISGDGIIVSGDCFSSVFKYGWFVTKFNMDGYPDTSFADKGIFIAPVVSDDYLYFPRKMEVYPDSKVVLFGQIPSPEILDFLTMRIITDLNVGVIDQQTGAENTLIYPNPIQERSTLKYTLNNKQKVSITLINSAGQTVTEFKDQESQDQGEYQIPLEFPFSLPPGAYLLNIRTETGTTTVKIMKN